MTQLSCDDPDVASTEGCFQYFTAESGSFESFGLASSSMICGHNYNVCIRFENNSLHAKTNTKYNNGINNVYHINFRPLEGYCCIEYTPTTWSVNVSLVKQYLIMKTFSANTKKLVFRM